MKNWKKLGLSLGAAALATVTLAACSSNANSNGKGKTQLTLWVDTTQVSYAKPVVKSFEKANPSIQVKVTQSPTGSANAKTDVSKDPSKAADVFELPNDQLGQMAQAGYINPLNSAAQKYVTTNDSAIGVKGVTANGKIYGYPFSEQAKVLFYNKAKLSADDVKTWEGMTAKGKVATTITDTKNGGQYTMVPAFISNGVQLYGADGTDLKGSTFNTPAGQQVMQWIANQKKNPGVVDASTAAISDLKNGKADAYLDGPWDSTAIKKALGDNFAVTTYPTTDFGGGVKQMQSFVGVEGFAVNSKSDAKTQAAAVKLAEYITSEKTQLNTWWKAQGQIPVNIKAQQASSVANDEMAAATMKQVNFSTLMPSLPEMANMWNLSGPLIVGAYNGTITPSNYQTKLTAFNTNIAKSSN